MTAPTTETKEELSETESEGGIGGEGFTDDDGQVFDGDGGLLDWKEHIVNVERTTEFSALISLVIVLVIMQRDGLGNFILLRKLVVIDFIMNRKGEGIVYIVLRNTVVNICTRRWNGEVSNHGKA
jgi:hypothetical protein